MAKSKVTKPVTESVGPKYPSEIFVDYSDNICPVVFESLEDLDIFIEKEPITLVVYKKVNVVQASRKLVLDNLDSVLKPGEI